MQVGFDIIGQHSCRVATNTWSVVCWSLQWVGPRMPHLFSACSVQLCICSFMAIAAASLPVLACVFSTMLPLVQLVSVFPRWGGETADDH